MNYVFQITKYKRVYINNEQRQTLHWKQYPRFQISEEMHTIKNISASPSFYYLENINIFRYFNSCAYIHPHFSE